MIREVPEPDKEFTSVPINGLESVTKKKSVSLVTSIKADTNK